MPKEKKLNDNGTNGLGLYALMAKHHWEESMPEAYKELLSQGSEATLNFFTAIEENALKKHDTLAEDLKKKGHSEAMAEQIAREIVLAEDIYIQLNI